jgi:small subunit ribosomal protein S9
MVITKKENSNSRAVGRRKTASARVRLELGKGEITINDRPFTKYFPLALYQQKVKAPLEKIGKESDFIISVKVVGGGLSSQADAVRHGIARALVKWNEDFRAIFKAEGFLTRDPRAKERKKFGKRRARRGHQWRKR